MSDEGFISRWSRKKSEAKAPGLAPAPKADEVPGPAAAVPAPPPVEEPLPPVESLTPDSDFTPFMRSGVDPDLKRKALKTLLSDPRFNVMDGLDTYIDDYSKPDPLPQGWLEKMTQTARLGEYIDPEPVVLAPDAENAAKTAHEGVEEDAARTENAAFDAAQAEGEGDGAADTSDGGLTGAKVKESPPPA